MCGALDKPQALIRQPEQRPPKPAPPYTKCDPLAEQALLLEHCLVADQQAVELGDQAAGGGGRGAWVGRMGGEKGSCRQPLNADPHASSRGTGFTGQAAWGLSRKQPNYHRFNRIQNNAKHLSVYDIHVAVCYVLDPTLDRHALICAGARLQRKRSPPPPPTRPAARPQLVLPDHLTVRGTAHVQHHVLCATEQSRAGSRL